MNRVSLLSIWLLMVLPGRASIADTPVPAAASSSRACDGDRVAFNVNEFLFRP